MAVNPSEDPSQANLEEVEDFDSEDLPIHCKGKVEPPVEIFRGINRKNRAYTKAEQWLSAAGRDTQRSIVLPQELQEVDATETHKAKG
jgi:hypothetical protein